MHLLWQHFGYESFGKILHAWYSYQTDEDIDNDALFWKTLEDELDSVDLWYESGEGDGLDIMICGEYEGDDSVDGGGVNECLND